MITFGIPQEVRDLEMRVGLTPAGVLALAQAGHTVYVQAEAGAGAGFSDEAYRQAGAHIVYSAGELYGRADFIVKITRPVAAEHGLFRPGQTIFSFLHLSVASPDLLQALESHEITAVAFEMITEANGARPVLRPASEVAGRMAPLVAGQLLGSYQPNLEQRGLGVLLNGLAGVPPATVVIVGGGVLGRNAARACVGLGAEVTVLDHDVNALRVIDNRFDGRATTIFANEYNLKRAVAFADVLIGAISTPGRRAPILITRDMVRSMRQGSVIMDCSIDQGGCVETTRPTTLRDPAFVAEGIIHYAVPNMTAVYARTTSHALTNAALPYLLAAAENGLAAAAEYAPALARGVNVFAGKLTSNR
jgi:alanine dehydrogenase